MQDRYNLAMSFCRVQEFYESSYKEIRDKSFSLLYFMSLYRKKRKSEVFTYPEDWCGFNIPGPVIEKCYFKTNHPDINFYDKLIISIHQTILKETKGDLNYYLIASEGKDKETIKHELAHSFYFIDKEYKRKVDLMVNKLIPSIHRKIKNYLLKLGYTQKVIKDEIQAYLCTSCEMFKEDIKHNKKEALNFLKVETELKQFFNHYRNKKNNIF
jgi:hypothetical protein